MATRSFHEIFAAARRDRGYSLSRCASSAGVGSNEITDWEKGPALPTVLQLRKIFGATNAVEHFLPKDAPTDGIERSRPPVMLKPKTAMAAALVQAGVVTEGGTPLVKYERPAKEPSPATASAPAALARVPIDVTGIEFPRALTMVREDAAYSQDDVAGLLKVDVSTVRYWERGEYAPILTHLQDLIVIFPGLAKAKPVADHRDKSKSGPATGTSVPKRRARAPQGAPGALPPQPPAEAQPSAPQNHVAATPAAQPATPPTPLLDPLSAIDRVVMAFDALGQPASFASPARTGGTWRLFLHAAANPAEVLAEGTGLSMHAAALAMLTSLRAGMAARAESSQRIVDGATARLASQKSALAAIDGAIGG